MLLFLLSTREWNFFLYCRLVAQFILMLCVQWRWHRAFGGVSDSQWGQMAMIFAAAYGRYDCARLLIDGGVEKNSTDNVRVGLCFADASCWFVSPLPTTFLSWFICISPSTSLNLMLSDVEGFLNSFNISFFYVSFPPRLTSRHTTLEVFYFCFHVCFVTLSYCVQWLSCHVNGWKLNYQNGRTALWYAARCGRVDCLRLLIDAGADKDVQANVRVSR